MKMAPECPDCVMGRVQYAADLVGSDRGPEAEKVCRDYLASRYVPGVTANIPTTSHIHRTTNRIIGDRDPWRELKERSNQVAETLLPVARRLVMENEDPFRAAVAASIVGNCFDFGIQGRESFDPEHLLGEFERLMQEGLGVDDTPRLRSLLERGGEVLLAADNCGEIVFDKLLIEQLRRFPVSITYLVKGVPVLSDATREDALQVGLDRLVDEILDTGTDHVGCWLPESDPALTTRVEETDLIIAKGMGHYEAFSEWEYRPIAYLLRSKCHPVARSLGVGKDLNVCRVME